MVDFFNKKVTAYECYLRLIPHALVVREVTGEAAAVLPSPAVEVTSSPTAKLIVYLVSDMLVGNISHPLVTA